MKHVLVLSRNNKLRGPLAATCIKDFRKCEAEIISCGTAEDPTLPAIGFDYVITVCDEAKSHLPQLKGKPLLFHYHFQSPANETELAELKASMKQYFERFCKMYLNEFS
jgi:protein-tyrosine-phosphatase